MPLRILCGTEEDVSVFVGPYEEVEDPATTSLYDGGASVGVGFILVSCVLLQKRLLTEKWVIVKPKNDVL